MGKLLKVLGMTTDRTVRTIHRPGEKVGGLAVDNRWTTVDNLGAVAACGLRAGFTPRFSTAKSPVDNLSHLRKRRFSTVCTGAMKTMSYLF
ncbi:hypothetical protein [Micromonospora sp. NPDC053811]|uniref:hypothetical protein n=1 Tax=Micromonospora sp. NPDC053811 TaxID=3154956 RepID=UPI0034257E41